MKADVQEIKRSVNLVDYIQGKGVKLRRQGKGFVGLCPFHADKKPSFTVDQEKSLWHCFGCGKGGDLFTFLQELEKLTFAQALDTLKAPSGDGSSSEGHRATAQIIFTRVLDFYHRTFYEDPRGLEYLRERRGLHDKEIYETFKIGFANGSLFTTLPKSGELVETLKSLGILTPGGAEFFHNRVVIPLTNEDGQPVGAYGRSIDDHEKNPHLYLKGPHKGVFNWQAAKRSRELFLTEGIIDALSLYQAGFRDVISLYGVNGLTENHIDLFKKYRTQKLYFVFDNDAAGEEACPRIAHILSPVESFKVTLPASVKDANDFFRDHGTDEFNALFNQALPVETAPKETHTTREDLEGGFALEYERISYRVRIMPSFDDRLRVTLKALCGEKVFVDTLDLYSHKSRQSAINQVSKKFSLAKDTIETHILAILEEAEKRAYELSQAPAGAAVAVPSMSEAEEEEARSFLTSPTLVEDILNDMETLCYVGEDSTKLLAYLIGISRKLERPLSGIISSSSGAGKSHCAELVESLTPPEDVILFSRLSPQALGYMEKYVLKHKLLIIEERSGSEAADYSIRTLQTRRKLTQGVVIKDPSTGKMYTKTYTVEGPIAYLETTTSGMVNPENSTRCFELYLDESTAQTRHIHRTQRHLRTLEGIVRGASSQALMKKHQNAQRLLTSLHVVIPYAPLIEFPSIWLRTRRDNERFLCLIEAICFLHQHQRERKYIQEGDLAEGAPLSYIEATIEDYRLAHTLARDVLSHTLQDLKKHSRELLDEIAIMTGQMAAAACREPHEIFFSRRDIREHTKWSDRKIKECLGHLVDLEYLLLAGGSQGKLCVYQVPPGGAHPLCSWEGLTTPEELEEKFCGGNFDHFDHTSIRGQMAT